MNDPSKPPRHRRFQFSLRTLMICVLAYCGCWLLTMRWGGYDVMQTEIGKIKKHWYGAPVIIEHEGGMTLTIVHNRDREREDRGVWVSTGYVTSPIPFILKWHLRSVDRDIVFKEETFVWLFDVQILVNEYSYDED